MGVDYLNFRYSLLLGMIIRICLYRVNSGIARISDSERREISKSGSARDESIRDDREQLSRLRNSRLRED